MNNLTTNQQLAALLAMQTYDERMEMAAWFRDVVSDVSTKDELDADWFASCFSRWAAAELDDEPDDA